MTAPTMRAMIITITRKVVKEKLAFLAGARSMEALADDISSLSDFIYTK